MKITMTGSDLELPKPLRLDKGLLANALALRRSGGRKLGDDNLQTVCNVLVNHLILANTIYRCFSKQGTPAAYLNDQQLTKYYVQRHGMKEPATVCYLKFKMKRDRYNVPFSYQEGGYT